MLAEYLGVPFPRNRRPRLETCVMHGHMLYTPLMRNVTVVFRDGRDVMVSWYFHLLFENDQNSPDLVKRTRSELRFADFNDVKSNLSHFIEYIFEKERASSSPYHFTWNSFVRSWKDRDVSIVRYEDATSDTVGAMTQLVERITNRPVDIARLSDICERYSFETQAKRRAGDENRSSFLRKGRPGDWREKFDRRAALAFEALAGDELRALGYASTSDWIYEVE